LQFVRTVSTSKSLAPAVVALAQYFNWMRVLILRHSGDRSEVTASCWSDSLAAGGIHVQTIRTDGVESRRNELDGFDPVSLMSRILESLQRVVIVLAPTDYIGSIALAADANGMVSAGWAWLSDALCALVDFRGDTAQVPLLHHSSARHRRPCSLSFLAACRRSLCGRHCMDGCTCLLSCRTTPAYVPSTKMCVLRRRGS
jgi:hypothetical protein